MRSKGFVDLHTHGIGRYDAQRNSQADILKVAELNGRAGTEALCLAIYPGPVEVMRKNMEAVRKAIDLQKKRAGRRHFSAKEQQREAAIIGVHLEGPFLNPVHAGSLDAQYFQRPTVPQLKKLVDGYEDIIKVITVAPEVPGGLKVVEAAAGLGIRVNMGHSDATYDEALDGKKAGATGITHLFNAMRPFHHREPGLPGFGLLDEDIYTEVIADGVHLHPKTLEMVFNRKRLDRIILVSDTVKGRVRHSGAYGGRAVYNAKGILAGSGITIADAVALLKEIGIPEAGISEAATDNPARYIGLGIH
ncbi:MAG: N-acetylglucosamine-6-phosphate deacetylase [Thermodesulfovibrionales bacterium]